MRRKSVGVLPFLMCPRYLVFTCAPGGSDAMQNHLTMKTRETAAVFCRNKLACQRGTPHSPSIISTDMWHPSRLHSQGGTLPNYTAYTGRWRRWQRRGWHPPTASTVVDDARHCPAQATPMRVSIRTLTVSTGDNMRCGCRCDRHVVKSPAQKRRWTTRVPRVTTRLHTAFSSGEVFCQKPDTGVLGFTWGKARWNTFAATSSA